MKQNKLRMTGSAYQQLRGHLFPGDGCEAIAFALCGHLETENKSIFMVHSVFLYPYDKCTIRHGDRVEWSPAEIVHLFEMCRKKGLRLLKIHSHPELWPFFSQVDDQSDRDLSDTLTGWIDRDDEVCSVIMLPDGSMIGRLINLKDRFLPLDNILVIADDIACFCGEEANVNGISRSEMEEDIQLRTRQAFGEGTTNILKKLKIGVVGCSGTGSIVAELLARLGVGSLVLIDHDRVEYKNVNRILNSTTQDVKERVFKVDMIKKAIERMGVDVHVTAISSPLHSMDSYFATASCDIVFGCMDTVDGRYLLNRIATYFCSAYFDIGIRLDADGKGGINEIMGRVDYIQPGLSSLMSRGRITKEQLKEADLARTDPEEHKKQVKEGYIKSTQVESPAVISINMMFSSNAVTEMLARLHPFRDCKNGNYAAVTFSVSGFLLIAERESEVDHELKQKVGLGHKKPMLDAPMLIVPSIKKYDEVHQNSVKVLQQG
jgi:ThiF family